MSTESSPSSSASNPDTDALDAFIQLDVSSRGERFSDFLSALEKFCQTGREADAFAWARRAVDPQLDYASAMDLHRFLVPGPPTDSNISKPVRLAILGGSTTHQLRDLIEVFLAGEQIRAEIYEADYGLFRQEILMPGSGLDQFGPQVIFLATSCRNIGGFPRMLEDETSVKQLLDTEVSEWAWLWETANTRWNATIIQNNFEVQPGSVIGHFNQRHAASREQYVERLNRLLADRAPAYVLIHDLRGLSSELGTRAWFDPRYYYEYKMPCGPELLVPYAHSIVSLLCAIAGKSKKVLVLDLDNTLWGGVIGDLGAGAIRFGQGSGEGEAFLAFQTYALQLRQRGVLLAVCSKNNESAAREPFEKRDDMVLKLADISCFVANWENKADNLRNIARQLDLKPDSLVFVDDNPAERALVRRLAPEVAVPDMPEDPAGYIQALAIHRYFETVGLTAEDAARTQYYADNNKRREMAAGSSDVSSFLISLKMHSKVEPINEFNIERVTQLLNKSNQFNLTTRRRTVAEVRELTNSADWRTLTFTLVDALGDNGLISIILLRGCGKALEIDTWVMSCRVLLRGMEQFARNQVVEIARSGGFESITGCYIPTEKNSMVKDHFPSLGFTPAGTDGGQTFWTLQLNSATEPLPTFIEREITK
jgi:FkbH-like protein